MSSLPLFAPFLLHGYPLHPPLPAYPPPLENALTTADATLAVQPKGEALRQRVSRGVDHKDPVKSAIFIGFAKSERAAACPNFGPGVYPVRMPYCPVKFPDGNPI